MSKKRSPNEDDVTKICEFAERGYASKEIAKQTGWSDKTVQKYLGERGYEWKGNKYIKKEEEEMQNE